MHIIFYSEGMGRNTTWLQSLHTCMYHRKTSQTTHSGCLINTAGPWMTFHSVLFHYKVDEMP